MPRHAFANGPRTAVGTGEVDAEIALYLKRQGALPNQRGGRPAAQTTRTELRYHADALNKVLFRTPRNTDASARNMQVPGPGAVRRDPGGALFGQRESSPPQGNGERRRLFHEPLLARQDSRSGVIHSVEEQSPESLRFVSNEVRDLGSSADSKPRDVTPRRQAVRQMLVRWKLRWLRLAVGPRCPW